MLEILGSVCEKIVVFFLFFFFFFSFFVSAFLNENNGAAFRLLASRLLALFVPNSIGTLKRALTKQNGI